MKICNKCGIGTEFYRDSTHVDGFGSICKDCKKAYGIEYHEIHKVLRNKISLERHYLKKYGITREQKAHIFEIQNKKCAICETPDSIQWNLDHNHTTDKNRGILCNACNFMIGLANDNPEILETGAAYLRRHANV